MQNYFNEIQRYQTNDTIFDNPIKALLMLLPGLVLLTAFLLQGSAQMLNSVNHFSNGDNIEYTKQQKETEITRSSPKSSI